MREQFEQPTNRVETSIVAPEVTKTLGNIAVGAHICEHEAQKLKDMATHPERKSEIDAFVLDLLTRSPEGLTYHEIKEVGAPVYGLSPLLWSINRLIGAEQVMYRSDHGIKLAE